MAAQTFSKNKTSLDDEIVKEMTTLNMMHAKTTSENNTMMHAKTTSKNNTEYDEIVDLVWSSCERGIPRDLLVQILLKLPVKSLVRFKAVCKPWKLLIDSTIFIDNHLLGKHPQEGLLVITNDNIFQKAYDLPFGLNYSVGTCNGINDNRFQKAYDLPCGVYRSWGTCNGIICFETDGPNPLVLFNPSTREFSFLPKECEAYSYGFCYLSDTQEYKVLCFTWRDSHSIVDMMILTLGMNSKSSREVKDITLPGDIDHSHDVAICETFIAWLGHDKHKRIVICYDVFEDRFTKMNLPPTCDDLELGRYLSPLKNEVIMLVYPFLEQATYFEMWKLIHDGGSKDKSWVQWRKVGPLETHVMYPIHASWDGKWIICRTKDDSYEIRIDQLCCYDLETNQIFNYDDDSADPQAKTAKLVRYVDESLVSPNRICSMY